MSKRIRYTVNDINNNRFYQLPKFLFEGEFKALSNDARVLYSLLRDRHELSIANNWVNEKGEVYLVYTRKNMEEMLGLSDKTVKKAVEQLKKFNLMEEEKMGLNRPNRIYLTAVSLENTGVGESPIPESENFRFQNRKNSESRIEEFPNQESKNLRANLTDINETDINETKSVNQSENRQDGKMEMLTLEEILKRCELERLEQQDLIPKNIIPLIEKIIEELYYSESTIIDKTKLPQDVVRKNLQSINYDVVFSAVLKMLIWTEKGNEIKNPKAYLKSTLYNSIGEGDLSVALAEANLKYLNSLIADKHSAEFREDRKDIPEENKKLRFNEFSTSITEKVKGTEYEEILLEIHRENTKIFFDTWIKPIQNIKREGDKLYIELVDPFVKSILEDRHEDYLLQKFSAIGISSIEFNLLER